jgi:hypothetical protein
MHRPTARSGGKGGGLSTIHPAFGDDDAYRAWRDARMAAHPVRLEELVVEIGDMEALTEPELAALMERIRRCNMAVYVERRPRPGRDAKQAMRALGRRFGLVELDCNALADDDGITPLAVHKDGTRARYIPYTDRPITWHTDGYYNPRGSRVKGLMLHAERPAAQGGENRLMDAEMLLIALRDENPDWLDLLRRPDAMTIPGNDEEGMRRPATVGPVFYQDDGAPQMRYSARARNIEWAPYAVPAAAAIKQVLDGPSPFIFKARLEAGMGLVSNNVLHTREPFTDDPASPRLLYRARYRDRITAS